MDETVVELVALARQIAVQMGHTDLVNGLQPLRTLQRKFAHELEEFYTTYTETAEDADILAEAADCLYYAACASVQGDPTLLAGLWPILHYFGLDDTAVETSALAKYRYRASGPGKKDFARERALISAALAALEEEGEKTR